MTITATLDDCVPVRLRIEAELEALLRLEGEGAGELLLVRHARQATRFEGEPPADPMLSCEGLEQAEALAERLNNLWIEAVYSGPERRTLQTAKVLTGRLERPLYVLDGLGNIEFDAELAAARGSYQSYAQRFIARPRWDSMPGFEASPNFRQRVLRTIDGVLAAHTGRRVLVVTHDSVINAYLSALLCVPSDLFFAAEHASVSTVRFIDSLYAVRGLNDTSHLPSPVHGRLPAPAFTRRSLALTNR